MWERCFGGASATRILSCKTCFAEMTAGGVQPVGKFPLKRLRKSSEKIPRKFAADKVLGLADPEFEEDFGGKTESYLRTERNRCEGSIPFTRSIPSNTTTSKISTPRKHRVITQSHNKSPRFSNNAENKSQTNLLNLRELVSKSCDVGL